MYNADDIVAELKMIRRAVADIGSILEGHESRRVDAATPSPKSYGTQRAVFGCGCVQQGHVLPALCPVHGKHIESVGEGTDAVEEFIRSGT